MLLDTLDFPLRLDVLRQAIEMTCRGLAWQLRVNARLVFRCKAGPAPGSGHLVSLLPLAAGMGLLHLLLPEIGQREEDRPETPDGHQSEMGSAVGDAGVHGRLGSLRRRSLDIAWGLQKFL